MYIKVIDIVPKCTEKSEGLLIYKNCCDSQDSRLIKLDFDGVINVTDDFVFAFLGAAAKNENLIDRIQYVRIKTYIKNRFKRAHKMVVAIPQSRDTGIICVGCGDIRKGSNCGCNADNCRSNCRIPDILRNQECRNCGRNDCPKR